MDLKGIEGGARLVSATSDLLFPVKPAPERAEHPKTRLVPPQLGIIISLRLNENVDVVERLSWKDIPSTSNIEVIVIDDGSRNCDDLKRLCAVRSWRYIYLETADAPFSLARGRNVGICASTATHVYFEDVDFLHQSNFYSRLIGFGRELERSPFNFAAVPTLFLTAAASTKLISSIADREAFDAIFQQYVDRLPFINPDDPNELCESFAPVGSNILVRRDVCHHVGLFDEYFNGWGGEDRDFVFRLLQHNSYLLRPRTFGETKKWAIHRTNAFEGWRALYRLHGDWLRSSGLYAVHIYHAENTWKNPEARRANFVYAETKARELAQGKLKLRPVPFSQASSSVFIGRNPVFYNEEVMKILGSVQIVEPDQKIEPEVFAQVVRELAPKQVFFQNPYGNIWLFAVWAALRSEGVRCVCAERGALPGSIYFDEGGFCGASPSYSKERWERSPPVDAREYLATLREQGQSLEPQGAQNVDQLKSTTDPEKLTVLVLLQSLTDATTLHFTHPLPNYETFLSIITSLAVLGRYNVLIKNHPLNKVHPLPGVGINVDAYPMYDLFDVADAVVALNSGGGILAMAAGLQVITLGTAFYAQDGLANAATDLTSLVECLEKGAKPKREDVDRFFGYLVNDFYSFADWRYGTRNYSGSTKMSTMQDIRYSRIVIGDKRITVERRTLNEFSLIMDPYALDLFLERKKTGNISIQMRGSDAERGYAAYHGGRFAEAVRYLDRALHTSPQNVILLRSLAEAQMAVGAGKTKGVVALKRAHELLPNNKRIRRRMWVMRHPWLASVFRNTVYAVPGEQVVR